ncbi:DUF1801 domain-containing protein [Asticcacaulis sp. ZE23SCel15]|uniref:DUF1801 domain-containing protein n=1 Tax=Asticcacaulis sp. ZE23SCel15 TaxID=3059027 RepID=UPI00265FF338|nr:DUF1801 domain-containing protein [Asticcacaulis sp. ZE23SCel15]WKL57510.1 DUF1801 domain-containing protein [Asticcacaulis sp. ZE23SCel15]
MAELKTQPTDADPSAFIAAVPDPKKRADCETLLTLFTEVTGEPPVMWGPSIVGYGRYTYINTTKKPADWPLTGFSPRAANLTLYIMPGFAERPDLMDGLGKYKTSVSCLYLKSLKDVDTDRLRALIRWGYEAMKARYTLDCKM